MAYNKGDLVKCVDCNGKHTGRVVHVMDPWYGVAWDDRNANFGQPDNTEPQFPADFVKAHKNHLMTVSELAIDPIV